MRADILKHDAVHDVHVYEVPTADLDAVAEHCKALHNAGHTGSSDMKLAASVPAFFIQKYINDNKITFAEFMRDQAHMRRFLDDPALAHFRIWKGRI